MVNREELDKILSRMVDEIYKSIKLIAEENVKLRDRVEELEKKIGRWS